MYQSDLFISIIVPCYNQAQYLEECLQSVLDQTYNSWECIIVNDGSPDNTEEVALEWCVKDTRFRYIEQQNGGLCSARNAGISIAEGEWILPLDADDKLGVDYLKLSVNAIYNNPDVGLVYCNAMLFGEENSFWYLEDYSIERLLAYNIIFCSALYKKEDWLEAGGYDLNLKAGREDWEFWINILGKTRKKVIKLDYIGFFYRRKKGSMDYNLNRDKEQLKLIRNYVYEKHKDIYMEYFGTPQDILQQKFLSEKRLQYFDNRMYKIRSNLFTRILNAIINRLI